MSGRSNKYLRNEDSASLDKGTLENLKRIRLLLDRIILVLEAADPWRNDQAWLSDILTKAKSGAYFINIGVDGQPVMTADCAKISFRGVDWSAVKADIEVAYSSTCLEENLEGKEKAMFLVRIMPFLY